MHQKETTTTTTRTTEGAKAMAAAPSTPTTTIIAVLLNGKWNEMRWRIGRAQEIALLYYFINMLLMLLMLLLLGKEATFRGRRRRAGANCCSIVVTERWLFMGTRKDLQCDTATEIATEKSVRYIHRKLNAIMENWRLLKTHSVRCTLHKYCCMRIDKQVKSTKCVHTRERWYGMKYSEPTNDGRMKGIFEQERYVKSELQLHNVYICECELVCLF